MSNIRSIEEIEKKQNELRDEISIIRKFLYDVFNEDTRDKIEHHLKFKLRELEVLEWVYNDSLPF